MIKNCAIHLAVASIKIAVDDTDWSDFGKVAMKCGIDLVGAFLIEVNNSEQNKRQKRVWDKQSIKACAKANGLEKIVIFPYPLKNGGVVTLIKMYGGNVQQFSSSIGITLLNDINGVNSDVDYYERTHGEVFYKREDKE